MPSCALRYCKSRYGKISGPLIGFFSFPAVDNLAREKWIQFVQKDRSEENWLPSAASKICSKHFRKEDIYFGKSGRAILRKGSVPYTTNEDSLTNEDARPPTPIDVDVADSEPIFDTPQEIALKAQVKKQQKLITQFRAKLKKLGQQNKSLERKLRNLNDYAGRLEKKV